jgi:ABC-2 type transport system permease protein
MRALRSIRLVAMREILERGRSRGYVLSLVFTLLLLGAGFILPSLLLNDQARRIAVVEPAPPGLQQAVEATADAYGIDVVVSRLPDRAAAEAAVRDDQVAAALVVPADLSGPGVLIVHQEARSDVRAIATGAVQALRAAGVQDLLSPPAVTALAPPTASDTTALIFANAGIILMFIGIFSYGTWVLTGVVEEKQSRVVEVVLSTVRPRDLLMGKVLGIGALALFQLTVLVTAGLIAVQISGRLTLPATTVSAVVQLLTWFILGFALYSTTLGFLGSLASRVEDASNASMPVTMTATACYLASILLVTQDPDGVLAHVMTFFPPSAPMVVPLRTALGAIEPWEVILSMGLMVVAIWALFVVGARVYAGAVLQVGSRMRIRDAWRARS